MIYKFKVSSEEDDKFFMDIEIMSEQTFYDLHNLIQEELEYDSSFLASFFIANHNWQKKQEIMLIEMDKSATEKNITMDKAVLSNFIKDAHQKLIYVFDNINNRSFFIELIETKQDAINRYYPVCTDFGGEIPPQFEKKSAKKLQIFDEEDDEDVFSEKKVALINDDDLDEDFSQETFGKDIQIDEFEGDSMPSHNTDKIVDEPENEANNEDEETPDKV